MLCLAPDAGGASGETAVDIPEQRTGQDEAVQDTQEAERRQLRRLRPLPRSSLPWEQQAESDTERAQEDAPEKKQTAPLRNVWPTCRQSSENTSCARQRRWRNEASASRM